MELKELLVKNLKRLRKANGLSQRELARLAKLDSRYINRLEQNPQNVRLDHLKILADALGVPPYTLIKEPDESEPKARQFKKLDTLMEDLKKTLKQIRNDS